MHDHSNVRILMVWTWSGYTFVKKLWVLSGQIVIGHLFRLLGLDYYYCLSKFWLWGRCCSVYFCSLWALL